MSQGFHPVARVQHHLRRAATLLAEEQFEAAIAEVDAALAVDAASLQAQTLRERIRQAQVGKPRPPTSTPPVSPLPPKNIQSRFVPTGVNVDTWLGFEQRIQERRYKALIETARAAAANGDGVNARLALEEARELRPDAPEIDDVSARIALLPAPAPPAPPPYVTPRTISAVSTLLVGMALLIALDWARTSNDTPVTPSTASEDIVASEIDRPAAPLVMEEPIEPPLRAAETAVPLGEIDSIAVATAGVQRAIAIEAVEPAAEALPAFQPEPAPIPPPVSFAPAPLAPPPVSTREVPDDYVAPPSRREAFIASPPSRVAGNGLATNVVREPAPSVVPPAARPVVVPRADTSRVEQVLNQYARAYGQLDASAAREVWPTVNERALARAFAGLQSQAVSFDDCNIDVRGERANASCSGRATYVGKIGRREPQTESRMWVFELRRDGDAWKIESAEARRR